MDDENLNLRNTILLEQESRILSGNFKDFELYKVGGKCLFRTELGGIPTGTLLLFVCTKTSTPRYQYCVEIEHYGINYLMKRFYFAAQELKRNLDEIKKL